MCPLCGSTGQGTVRGARLRVRPRLCTCVGRRAGSQRVCNACGCLRVQTRLHRAGGWGEPVGECLCHPDASVHLQVRVCDV